MLENIDWEKLSKRRWDVTIFRDEVIDGKVRTVVAEEYKKVASTCLTGRVFVGGELHFRDNDGREIIASNVSCIVKEVAPE